MHPRTAPMKSTAKTPIYDVSEISLASHSQVKQLQEQNKGLEEELMENQKLKAVAQQAQWEQQNPPAFLVAGSHPTLCIGYPFYCNLMAFPHRRMQHTLKPSSLVGCRTYRGEGAAQAHVRNCSSLLPPWMHRHPNG
ncbi:hypothetical protein MUK42_02944 [Musa troglodytarum]|uniref:Uncharacterized protein n=1 Tax=Musa troglodytarum TaxID=320322 RepID=A0A9E7LBN2_9LILI|nr:hypothetical protein MUK42_02944 [Musa troglodytarum]